MNAKARANFINSVANGNSKPCPNCGILNDINNECCSSCGSYLVERSDQPSASGKICPMCGTVNDEDDIFCSECGAQLEPKEQTASEQINVNKDVAIQGQAKEGVNTAQDEVYKTEKVSASTIPAFAPIKKTSEKQREVAENGKQAIEAPMNAPKKVEAFNQITPEMVEDVVVKPVFAQGLPEWDIVPPQVVVKKKGRKK